MAIERRTLMKTAALGGVGVAAAAASSLPKPALAQERRELTMVTTWPKNFPGLGTGAQRVADRITAATGGELTVTLYAAGELVGAFDSFDAVSAGTADCWHGAAYYWQGKSQGFNFFTAVPFGFTATELMAWIHYGGGQELWDELAAGFNVKPFMAGNTGLQMGGWFRQEVNTPEDFSGLRFRMPGLGGEVLRRLGAAVVNLPGGEIFPSLQSGAIDATEWVGPWNDLAFGFYRVASYYYYPGFHEPGSGLEFSMNKEVYDSLSDEHKAIVAASAAAENDIMLAEFNARNNDALNTLITEHGVELRKFSPEIFQAFGEAAEDVLAEAGATDEINGRIYESFVNFREKAMAWTNLSDFSYVELRNQVLENIRG
jgi:TRAP-type mannitol/chloroaromatic compound transport system substrate-binding protein